MASVLHHNSGILIPRAEYEELTEALATVFRIGSRFTPRLIERLDLADGDPDLEGEWSEDEISSVPTWVSLDDGPGCQIADAGGQCDEDDLNTNLSAKYGADGPGCELSDPDCAVDDTGCDPDEGF